MEQKNNWTISFLGFNKPIITIKLNHLNENTIYRQHYDFVSDCCNWLRYHFYIAGYNGVFTYKDFVASLFLTKLSEIFGCDKVFYYLRINYDKLEE